MAKQEILREGEEYQSARNGAAVILGLYLPDGIRSSEDFSKIPQSLFTILVDATQAGGETGAGVGDEIAARFIGPSSGEAGAEL